MILKGRCSKDAKVYGDSKSDRIKIDRTWGGEAHTIVRFEPFVLSFAVRFQPSVAGGPRIGVDGGGPHAIITPLETDSHVDKLNLGAPFYAVDAGLLAVPFPAAVSVVWKNRGAVDGNLFYDITSYGPERENEGLPSVAIEDWCLTRYYANAAVISPPEYAQRFSVPYSFAAATLTNASGDSIVGTSDPAAIAWGQDYTLAFLAGLTGPGVSRCPVRWHY